jgi:ankyrin repeat protein
MLVIAGGTTWTGYVHRRQNALTAALFTAAAQDNPHKLRLLLKEGADPDTKWRENRSLNLADECKLMVGIDPLVSDSGQTALMMATSGGRLEIVRALVDAGADVNMPDGEGQTALLLAARSHKRDSAAIILLLAKHGADLNARTWDGITAWDLAARNPKTLQALRQAAVRK